MLSCLSFGLFLQIVYSKFVDLVQKSVEVDDPDLRKPNEEEVREVGFIC